MNKMLKQNNKPWIYVQVNITKPIDGTFLRERQIHPNGVYNLSYINFDGDGQNICCSGGDLGDIITKRGISGEVVISGPIKLDN